MQNTATTFSESMILAISGVTIAPKIEPTEVFDALVTNYGVIALKSEPFRFSDYTTYYEKEMGDDLSKYFICFEPIRSIEFSHQLKLQSIALEKRWRMDQTQGEARLVNIDPGYVTLSKMVLFSTKNHSHRIYLADGIFAEITLTFLSGSYRANPWTYPDYQSPLSIDFFNRVREYLKGNLKPSSNENL